MCCVNSYKSNKNVVSLFLKMASVMFGVTSLQEGLFHT